MSNWSELDKAVELLRDCDLTVMQCSSLYPCPPNRVGINVINEIYDRYDCRVGFSDHTEGFAAAISSIAMGSTVIEKHFSFSKKMYGSDAPYSMEPNDFHIFCNELKTAFEIINNPIDKNIIDSYADMKIVFEKSIVSSSDISKGSTIKFSHLAFKKPGDGISTREYKKILGKKLKKNVPKNHKFKWSDFII